LADRLDEEGEVREKLLLREVRKEVLEQEALILPLGIGGILLHVDVLVLPVHAVHVDLTKATNLVLESVVQSEVFVPVMISVTILFIPVPRPLTRLPFLRLASELGVEARIDNVDSLEELSYLEDEIVLHLHAI